MHYPGHDNWQGMSYGLLDQTPTLTRTPSNPTVGDYLTEFQDRNRAWRESLKFPEFTPNSGRLDPEEEVEDPEDDPILGPVVRRRILPTPHEGDSQWEPLGPPERNAANNWSYWSPMERGIMAGALPGGSGHLLGSLNNWEAMNMDRTGWSKQFSPSLLDVATAGFFDSSGLYDQAALNMDNWNIAGRRGLMGKSPFMDYTHQYGPNFLDDVKEYDPWNFDGIEDVDPSYDAAAQAMEDIRNAQVDAAYRSYNDPMNYNYDFGGTSHDYQLILGEQHQEDDPAELDSGAGPNVGTSSYGEGYDDGWDHGMDYGGWTDN